MINTEQYALCSTLSHPYHYNRLYMMYVAKVQAVISSPSVFSLKQHYYIYCQQTTERPEMAGAAVVGESGRKGVSVASG